MTRPLLLQAALLAPICLVVCLAPPVWAGQDDLAPLHSATVATKLRTLRGLPLKRLITSAKGWRRVTKALKGAPPAPAFAQGEVCVLIVVDESGGARSWIESIKRNPKGGVRIKVLRRDGEVSVEPSIKAFFLRLKSFAGGIELLHVTRLPEDQGTIQRRFKADPTDRGRSRLPRLGPDLRFRWETPDGVAPVGLKLRHETRFPNQRRPAGLKTMDFPRGMAFPRLRRGTRERHVFAAYCKTHRCQKALLFDALPPIGADGSPRPIRHVFKLEPRPAGPQRK
ncbi:MAG: hypothetical protein JKY65_04275 [Planctomycetes bacterium]|nr:hypothetical protein [Planctomycetota bacterium]